MYEKTEKKSPTGRQKKAVYFRGALVSLAPVGGRHCPRQGFLFSARVHEVNRFFLPATKKKETRKKGKREREKENWKRKKNKGNLVEEKNSERYRKLFAKRAVFPESLKKASGGWFQRPSERTKTFFILGHGLFYYDTV